MRPQSGVHTFGERHNIEQELEQERLLASPTRPSTAGFSCNETPSWLHTQVREKSQRNSVFGRWRSYSNTPRSYPSSLNEDSESVSHQGSGEARYGPKSPSSDRPEGATKSILSRGGKMLRRHGSKFSLTSFILDEESERGSFEVSETCRRAQHYPIRSRLLGSKSNKVIALNHILIHRKGDLKDAISSPFDFHHVTHTQPRQFESLDRGSQNELITEFIAIRAAQRPKSTLQGIQADDLGGSRKVKQSDGQPARHQGRDRSSSCFPSSRPNIVISGQTSSTTGNRSRSMRSSVSIENFSRPAPWSVMSPDLPPLRKSSRNAPDSPPLPIPVTAKCGDTCNDMDNTDLKASTNLKPDFNSGPMAPGSNMVPKRARSSENWPLPTPSTDVISGLISEASTESEHTTTTVVDVSPGQSLRHASSLPTPRIVSQGGHVRVSNDHQLTAKKRPESLQPKRSGLFEDGLDQCTKYLARTGGKVDWRQKTIYVDADLEPADALALNGIRAVSPPLSKKEAQTNENRLSGTSPKTPRQFRVQKLPHLQSPTTYKKSVTELEERLSPFGRHQSASEFRGYQHCPERLLDPITQIHMNPENPFTASETAPIKGVCDFAEVELRMNPHATSSRCNSEGSSSFRAVRPLLHKYSSDGSVLSYITTTTPTNRSSNSFGSLPDLVHSPDSTRDSVMAEKISPTDSVNSGPDQIPLPPSPSLPSVESQGSDVQHPHGPCLSRANPLDDPTKQVPATAPIAPVKLAEPSHQSVGDEKKEVVSPTRVAPLPARSRAASAVTPGQRLTVRASYSLFPPQLSTPRLS